jgi:RimJ/RimL family protein N-acetyltransferase
LIRLVQVQRDGKPAEAVARTKTCDAVLASTLALYTRGGFSPPWTGYLALDGETCVGACAFTSPPVDGRVEIAYYTFPGNEGRGIGTQMAQALIDIARRTDARLRIIAHTLPQEGPSTHILGKLGFSHVGTAKDRDEGLVWEWHLL